MRKRWYKRRCVARSLSDPSGPNARTPPRPVLPKLFQAPRPFEMGPIGVAFCAVSTLMLLWSRFDGLTRAGMRFFQFVEGLFLFWCLLCFIFNYWIWENYYVNWLICGFRWFVVWRMSWEIRLNGKWNSYEFFSI